MRIKLKFVVFPFILKYPRRQGKKLKETYNSSHRQERISDENRRLPSTLASLTKPRLPIVVESAVIPDEGMTPGNKT